MGKCFIIEKIYNLTGPARLAKVVTVEEENGRPRILNLNPLRTNEATGVEMDSATNVVTGAPGYLLKASKPLSEWEDGDIVREELYPSELDR